MASAERSEDFAAHGDAGGDVVADWVETSGRTPYSSVEGLPAGLAHAPPGDVAAPIEPDIPFLANLLEQVPAIVYVADTGAAGAWRYVSPQIEHILGFTAEEWCANPRLWVERLHPADRAYVLEAEARSTRSGARPVSPIEYRLLDRRGRVVWIRDHARLLPDSDGCVRWHGVLSDITERKLAEAELERRAAQQAAVARLGEHALEGASTSELMHEAATAAAESLAVECVAIGELLRDEGCFLLRGGVGWPPSAIGSARSSAGPRSQAGYALITGAPVVVDDWATERRFEQAPAVRALGAVSSAVVAIVGRDGPFGALSVVSLQPRKFPAGDIDFLQALANVLADALARQATEDEIRHRALHDALTGLPNRVLFEDRLNQALARMQRTRTVSALLFLDLDQFKLVNDSLGHHVGDELLAAVAPRLCQALRSSDTVARFGGDEFGILLEEITGEREAIAMAERIASVFTRPFVLGGSEHYVSASIGIALARGGELVEELVRNADAAMYRAKERGRSRYELFDDAMRVRAITRLRIENDLRRALARHELDLVYQPVVSLSDARIVSIEALLRWRHPRLGLIQPSEFIAIAEESGLIAPIGQWVLERACRQAARWARLRPDAAPIGISVNLSAVQIARPSFARSIETLLDDTGVEPGSLILEITESVLLTDAEALTQTLRALKALGVRLTIDDFGTGYSALGYLTRLPLDALKVDRSFIVGLGSEPRCTAITEAVMGMSRALSLEVVAEGVETPLQIAELRRLGCRLAQGFYFWAPLSAGELTAMLQSASPPLWLPPTVDALSGDRRSRGGGAGP
jgi:diguanylate cyclase (GGDEF)-like protein/PAS domain S-box-containing protein